MLIISKFSCLNRISLGRLQIAAYNTPVLWLVPSNGWDQSKFNIRPRCESTTSGLKKFGDVSLSVRLNVSKLTQYIYRSICCKNLTDCPNVSNNFHIIYYDI